jgi:hypothetical protein
MGSALSLDQFKLCAKILVGATSRSMPTEQLEVYMVLLQDLPYDILYRACIRSVQELSQNFIPAAGRIREIAAELQYGVIPEASIEWGRVMSACRIFGVAGQANAKNALGMITWSVVNEIGWQSICHTEQPEITRTQFCKAYDIRATNVLTQRKLSPSVRTNIPGIDMNKMGVSNG